MYILVTKRVKSNQQCKDALWLCYLNAGVSCISYSLQQPVILWIESDSEGTVYYST